MMRLLFAFKRTGRAFVPCHGRIWSAVVRNGTDASAGIDDSRHVVEFESADGSLARSIRVSREDGAA